MAGKLSFGDEINLKSMELDAKSGPQPTNVSIPGKVMSVVMDLSDALASYNNSSMDSNIRHRKGVEVKLADAMIKILALSGLLVLDIGGALEERIK